MSRLLMTALALLMLIASARAQEVGELGDPEKIRFEGARIIRRSAIRAGLVESMWFNIAAHPRAPLETFITTIRESVVAGYRRAGFVDVDVAVIRTLDEDGDVRGLVVRITERRRILAGDIVVEGAKAIPAESIAAALSGPRPPAPDHALWVPPPEDEAPHWVPGEPVMFLPAGAESPQDIVQEFLRERGFYSADFDVSTEIDRKEGRARLLVTVRNEGERAKIAAVEVIGLEKNTKDVVMAYLGLRKGQPVDAATIRELETKLYESARFLSHEIEVEPRAEGGGVTLRITLVEYPPAPPLSEPLPPEVKSILRIRDWMRGLSSGWKEDLEVTIRNAEFSCRLVFSLGRGIIADARFADGSRFDALLTEESLTVLSPEQGRSLVVIPSPITPSVGFGITAEPVPSESPFSFGLSFRLGTESTRLRLEMAPVALLGTLLPPDGEKAPIEREEGRLTLDLPSSTKVSIDERTGRILEMDALADEGLGRRLRTVEGAFDGAKAEFDREFAKCTDVYRPGAPASSLAAFFLGGDTDLQAMYRRVLRPLDRRLVDRKHVGEKFVIPLLRHRELDVMDSFVNPIRARASRLFPIDSWPETLLREAAAVLSRRKTYSGAEWLRAWEDRAMGPVGSLATALVLRLESDEAAAKYADRGLSVSHRNTFLYECSKLVEGKMVNECLRQFLLELSIMDAERLNALAEVLAPNESSRPAVHRLLTRMRTPEFWEALAEFWDTYLGERVKAALEELK